MCSLSRWSICLVATIWAMACMVGWAMPMTGRVLIRMPPEDTCQKSPSWSSSGSRSYLRGTAWYQGVTQSGTPVRPAEDMSVANTPRAAVQPWNRSFTVACWRSEEHTYELQSLMRISYAVFCLKQKKTNKTTRQQDTDGRTNMSK